MMIIRQQRWASIDGKSSHGKLAQSAVQIINANADELVFFFVFLWYGVCSLASGWRVEWKPFEYISVFFCCCCFSKLNAEWEKFMAKNITKNIQIDEEWMEFFFSFFSANKRFFLLGISQTVFLVEIFKWIEEFHDCVGFWLLAASSWMCSEEFIWLLAGLPHWRPRCPRSLYSTAAQNPTPHESCHYVHA